MDKSKTNERDAGEQMKKDTWLLKGIYPQEWSITIEGSHSQTCLSSHYSEQKQRTSALLVCFRAETMVFCSRRVLILLICIGFIAVQPHKLYGLTSVEVILRHDRKAHGTLPHSQRSLKDVDMQGMDTKTSAQANKRFDPSQTSKRRARRGSDPIHNRSCIYLEKLRSHIDIGIQDDRYYDQGCTPFHKADNICDSPHNLIKLRDASPLDHPNYQRLSKISSYPSHFRFRVEYYTHTFGLRLNKYHCCRSLNVQDYEQQNICTRIEIQCPSLPQDRGSSWHDWSNSRRISGLH
ncbi:hypothetical protein NC652_026138 [Populus alba x Populus x berolinensis]|nr:hypothetical protein NC652_026138 [Populus alba x Populus x berolinensis]